MLGGNVLQCKQHQRAPGQKKTNLSNEQMPSRIYGRQRARKEDLWRTLSGGVKWSKILSLFRMYPTVEDLLGVLVTSGRSGPFRLLRLLLCLNKLQRLSKTLRGKEGRIGG